MVNFDNLQVQPGKQLSVFAQTILSKQEVDGKVTTRECTMAQHIDDELKPYTEALDILFITLDNALRDTHTGNQSRDNRRILTGKVEALEMARESMKG